MRIVIKKKGLVLVGVLWLVIILTVVISTTGRSSRLDTKVTMSRIEEIRCKWAGRGGVEKALALFNEDDTEADCLTDIWSNNPEDLNDIALERCRLTVRVVDESGKLNVNTATREQFLMLLNMTEDIADAIIDWRDDDDVAGNFGAEAGYYETLAYPYMPRNADFRTIRELLLVKDVTEDLLYGEDTNFNGTLDDNEQDGEVSPPYDDGDDEMDLGWIAYLTCYSSSDGGDSGGATGGAAGGQGGNNSSAGGMVNVNTAPEMVLMAILGSDSMTFEDAELAARDIVTYRDQITEGLLEANELVDGGAIDQSVFDQISGKLTTTSNIFTIYCYSVAERSDMDGARLLTEAVVDRSQSPAEILYWYQGTGY